ncbi:MAG: zinc ribbon domain-containing protein [Ruminococcus sp.]|nr:zinc ribbon domain-containing protein [Ruminococcus sp.]MCI7495763.1 zinc ribbon domain-containing protein [Ruminococcus sp.]
MICKKCGTSLQPNDRFCYACGAPIEPPIPTPTDAPPESPASASVVPPIPSPAPAPAVTPVETPTSTPSATATTSSATAAQPTATATVPPVPENPLQATLAQSAVTVKPSKRNMTLGFLSIGVGCLIIIGILCYLFSNNGYRSAVKEMWYGVERQDASGAAANMFPSEASSQLNLTEQTMETYLSTFQEHAARYGDNYHISIQFDDVEELDTEQLEQFNIWFQNLSLEKEVNKTYAVDYTRSISGKNGKEAEHRFCYIYRYDGNWYVLDTALLGLQDPLA